jgi:predicted transcriptional regulator
MATADYRRRQSEDGRLEWKTYLLSKACTPVRTARLNADLTQREVADAASMSNDWFAEIERGNKQPNQYDAARVAAVLKVSENQLWPSEATF